MQEEENVDAWTIIEDALSCVVTCYEGDLIDQSTRQAEVLEVVLCYESMSAAQS